MESSRELYSNLVAAALVFLGAVCFSAKAVIIKIAYTYGIDSVSLLSLRMVFSLPFFLAIAAYTGFGPAGAYARPSLRDYVQIALVGMLGYYLASLLDFLGLQYISASMERLILFVYPTLVVLLTAWWFRRPVPLRQRIALVVTYLGIGIALAGNVRVEAGPAFFLGAGFIFLSAFTFAIYLIASGELLPRIGTWRFTALAMTAASVAVLTHQGITHGFDLFGFPMPVYGLAVAMAILSTVLPSFMISEGIRRIGASQAAIIGSVGPISTIVLAMIFLNERLDAFQWMGTALVIGGVVFVSAQRRRMGTRG